MKSYAIIENNVVVNVAVADDAFAQSQGWVEISQGAGIGWEYIDGVYVDNRPVVVVDSTPTKEDLLAQINALVQQIQATP